MLKSSFPDEMIYEGLFCSEIVLFCFKIDGTKDAFKKDFSLRGRVITSNGVVDCPKLGQWQFFLNKPQLDVENRMRINTIRIR